jgi:hypothetical protein
MPIRRGRIVTQFSWTRSPCWRAWPERRSSCRPRAPRKHSWARPSLNRRRRRLSRNRFKKLLLSKHNSLNRNMWRRLSLKDRLNQL